MATSFEDILKSPSFVGSTIEVRKVVSAKFLGLSLNSFHALTTVCPSTHNRGAALIYLNLLFSPMLGIAALTKQTVFVT